MGAGLTEERIGVRSAGPESSRSASALQPFAGVEALAGLTMPALVVPGTDPEHPAELAERLARAIGAKLAAPDRLGSAVAAFVSAAPG